MNDPITLEITDAYLVEKIKEGDEIAYYHLYERYASKIYHVSKKMELSHHDAEEVVQDVFLYLWKKRNDLRSDLSINAYIFSIVRSLVIKRCQKKARFIAYQQYAIPMSKDFSNVTEDTVIYQDLHEFATKAIDTLPVKQREVFMLKTVNHMTAEEIAAQLNLSVRTVENQIYRATKSLRKQVESTQEVSLGLILVVLGLIS
ncbi:RNA polymerase sigma factor [Echinicola soli]|nr:RNA polymerase sigma-70 factor [Echinicola soli]